MFQTHCTAVYFIYRVWSAALQEDPSCLQGQPGLGRTSIFQVPRGTGLEGTGVPLAVTPGLGMRLPATLVFYGAAEVVAAGSKPSHPLQHPWSPGCSRGFPSNMGMLAWLWSHWAEGRGLFMSSEGFWGALSLGMTPGAGPGLGCAGSSWPQSCGGSAVLVLCLHSGDGAVKSRLLQKGTGHS